MSNRRNSGRERNPNTVPNEFGRLLETLRLETLDFTQPALAAMIGIDKGSISNYESGKSFPTQAIAEKLSEKLKSKDLMAAWYRVNEQREKDKAARRVEKSKKPKAARATKAKAPPASVDKLLEAFFEDDDIKTFTPEQQNRLRRVLKRAAQKYRGEDDS